MNNQPLVSILIACYNGEKYINTCLETCISQSYPNLDILIINDGSNDESLNILKKWESIDKRIRVISQKNVGLGETRNRLIKNCKGTYFTFVDIDDTIPNNAIELLVKNTDNNKNDVVAARSKLIYKNNSLSFPFIPSWRWVRNMTKGHYVKSNLCTPWGCLIKTSYFKSLNINFIPGREINHFTCLIIKKNIQILLNDKIILEKFQDPSTTYMGLYLKVEKSNSQQKKDLSCYLKRLRPHDDSELSLSFKQSKIFTEAFLDESFFVKPLYFHDDEIERLTSLLYYFEK